MIRREVETPKESLADHEYVSIRTSRYFKLVSPSDDFTFLMMLIMMAAGGLVGWAFGVVS